MDYYIYNTTELIKSKLLDKLMETKLHDNFKIGTKTIADYILYGGIKGKIFFYSVKTETMTIYRVEGLNFNNFPETRLNVVRIDEKEKGKKEQLCLFTFKNNLEVILFE